MASGVWLALAPAALTVLCAATGWLLWRRRVDRRDPGIRSEAWPDWRDDSALSECDAGLRRAEWEVARAAEYGREVAVALIGLDAPPEGDEVGARR